MIVIDYVDGRARTERISDSSATMMTSTSVGGHGGHGLITEVTIQPHGGTFVDSSSSSSDDQPPPPPPRTHLLHQYHQHQHSQHNHHHHHNHHPHHHHHPVKAPPGGGGVGYTTGNSKTNLSHHSSDSSSAYSGSDTMQSSVEEVDLSGLMESVVDSDEDEEEEEDEDLSETSLLVRDAVRECLEKDPSDRTEEDVDILLEFTQHLKAFTNMTMSVRRALVATMVFAVVEKAGTVVMTDGEELDSWSVIINGHVEIERKEVGSSSSSVQELHLGDAFGIMPTMDKLYHRGVMRTKCDDCQFVCVTQTDYYRILHQGEENQRRHEDDAGELVLVTEQRQLEEQEQRRGHVVIRGTPNKLMSQLMEDNSNVDPTFTEDFLLTYRTFLDTPVRIMEQLLEWFREPNLRDKVTRVLLLWVNNHFTDFETDPSMMEQLEKFEACLEGEKMQGQLRMLNFACAAKARRRTLTLTRPSRDEPLQFSVLGGYERGFGIFISRVEKGSKADEIGLKRGDQILEVNGQSFEHVTKRARALEILRSVCHLSITVKSNLLAFNEMLQTPEDTPRHHHSRSRGKSVGSCVANRGSGSVEGDCGGGGVGGGGGLSEQSTYSGSEGALSSFTSSSAVDDVRSQVSKSPSASAVGARQLGFSSRESLLTPTPTPTGRNKKESCGGQQVGPVAAKSGLVSKSSRINRAFNRFLHKPKSLISIDTVDDASSPANAANALLHANSLFPPPLPGGVGSGGGGASNPDLMLGRDSFSTTAGSVYEDPKSEFPEHVLKVFKADQTFKYLLVHKETTAHEVVMLSLQEFGITEPSSNFTLCEVSVAEGGFVKQRRLPDALQNLAERIGLASRYYIKNVQSSESLLPDDTVGDLVKESQVNMLQLNPVEVSTQLMVEDFTIFRQIEATEYVDDLFELKASRYGTPSLTLFCQLVNREMMWTISEVVSEPNCAKRMRLIKQYIKVARQCKETQNFNSMFAIISGLGHGAVSRLKASWEKLPTKYTRAFQEMQQLMDPSRNMSRYRNLVNGEDVQPPIIPFYPVVKKDLTFIHLANHSKVDNLVNFEKLRMIAKEVRGLTNMCSAPLDLFSMLELGGQQPSNAMVAMNQLTAGGQYLATVNRNRRKKASTVPNPKKMFEEAQMVRRVKAYLNNMKIIEDEERLHQMSLECEPPVGGTPHSLSQQSLRKRNPSPTPSAVSSASSASHGSNLHAQGAAAASGGRGPGTLQVSAATTPTTGQLLQQTTNQNLCAPVHTKFGAASPHAVKKLLSLSEQSKTRPKSQLAATASSSSSSSGAAAGANSSSSFSSPLASRKTSPTTATSPLCSASSSSSSSSSSGGGAAGDAGAGGGGSCQLTAVDLTAESSSVTSLPAVKKSHNAAGSVTSNDSGLGFFGVDPTSPSSANLNTAVVGGANGGSEAIAEARLLASPRLLSHGRRPTQSHHNDETQVSAV